MRICAGEEGTEMRGDAGRAQGLQRAATGGRCYDQVGDVRGSGHDEVGALRLKEAAYILSLRCYLCSLSFVAC
jgi:hypothetical protein